MAGRNLTNWVLALGSLTVSLIVAEVGVRCIPREGVPIPDPYLGMVMKPGGDLDANGFRNPQALTRADIVAVGDSQTMGLNATREEAWPLVLGSLTSSPVYSMAVVGYGPVQYAYLADRALALQPKLVIFGFYFGNDIYDAKSMVYQFDAWKDLRDPKYKDSRDGPGDPNKELDLIAQAGARPGLLARSAYAVRDWFHAHSRLYVLLGDATRSVRNRIGVAQSIEDRQRNVQEFADEHPEIAYVYDKTSPLSTTLSPRYRMIAVDLQNPETKEGWRITQDRFLAIKKKFDNAHVPFLILFIPTKEKVYLEFENSKKGKIPDQFSVYKAREDEAMATVGAFCAKNGIRCTSALQAMVNALARGVRIYDVTIDGHPQAPGYRAIAESAYHYLIEQNLLSARHYVAPW